MHTLVLSRMALRMNKWVAPFILYDDKFFLRNGAVHTEMGHIYPMVVSDKDVPQPGDDLITKRGEYLRIIQEESGKEKLHLRTIVDTRKFDHAERFYDFNNYAEIMQHYVTTLERANNRFFNSLIAGMMIGMTGGCVLFDEGTDLERFFQPQGKDITPTEAFSKMAREYYQNDGEVKKFIKQEIGRTVGMMKNKAVYDPTLVIDEINARSIEIKEKYEFPDLSDQNKLKQHLKKMYTIQDGGKQKTLEDSRRRCLWGLLLAISFKLERMTTTNSVYNWMGLDTSKRLTDQNLDDAYDIEMRADPTDLVVFMNSEDLRAGRVVVGGLELGMFSGTTNSTIADWEKQGVTFVEVPFFIPGSFLILPKQALTVVVYFDETYQESFKYHLVENFIKHLMLRVVGFQNFPGHFGLMDKFQPDPV